MDAHGARGRTAAARHPTACAGPLCRWSHTRAPENARRSPAAAVPSMAVSPAPLSRRSINPCGTLIVAAAAAADAASDALRATAPATASSTDEPRRTTIARLAASVGVKPNSMISAWALRRTNTNTDALQVSAHCW